MVIYSHLELLSGKILVCVCESRGGGWIILLYICMWEGEGCFEHM